MSERQISNTNVALWVVGTGFLIVALLVGWFSMSRSAPAKPPVALAPITADPPAKDEHTDSHSGNFITVPTSEFSLLYPADRTLHLDQWNVIGEVKEPYTEPPKSPAGQICAVLWVPRSKAGSDKTSEVALMMQDVLRAIPSGSMVSLRIKEGE